jgi:TolB-like protein/Flp pilus assembly protein TadD
MKRCPECRRDYYDDTLLYCLDDGNALLEGPASVDEPATAILHLTDAPGEAATRAQIHTTEQTAVLPSGITEVPQLKGFDKRLILAPLALAVIVLGGFFGYRYFSPTKQIESIAVMPFVNEGGNADVEYLSDGMTETLIKSLSNLPNLNVKPRSSVFRYKGKDTDLQTIAKELNVQAILNGRVVQRGDQLTLSLELVDVREDKVIWTEQYQRRQADVVLLQSEIAKDVSTHIKAKLSGAEEAKVTKTGTVNPEAYQAYLKGRYFWTRRTAINIRKALDEFKIATDLDPNYALAFVGLADCYGVLNEYAGVPSTETLPKARSYAERALLLDPQLAEARATLGMVEDYSWRFEESEKQFKLAIEANPNYATTYHWYSILLRNIGRFDEAAAMIKRAQEIDPTSSVIAVNVVRTYQLQGNDEAAIQASLKLIEVDPGFPAVHEYLALSYLRIGRHADAVVSAQKAVELSNRSAISIADLGFVYASIGRKQEAQALIKELEVKYAEKATNGLYIAAIYMATGDKAKAFEWLERDFQQQNGQVLAIRWQLQFDALHDDPRYKDLLRRLGIPN